MNAGGVDKACKSNGACFARYQRRVNQTRIYEFVYSKQIRNSLMSARSACSGERVSNAWVTTPKDETNPSKGGLILDGPRTFKRKSGVKGTRKRTAFGSACVLSASW